MANNNWTSIEIEYCVLEHIKEHCLYLPQILKMIFGVIVIFQKVICKICIVCRYDYE